MLLTVLDMYVEFFCPVGWVADSRAAEESLRPLKEALSSIDLHLYYLDFARSRRQTRKLIASTSNLELSAASVRNALSALEAFYVVNVRKKYRKLPVVQRPRKPRSLPPCDCEELLCKHLPQLTEAEIKAKWKREDATERQRRQQRNSRTHRMKKP